MINYRKRKALIVGVDYYESMSPLFGCVSDARKVNNLLERDANHEINFDTRLLISTGPDNPLRRNTLRSAIEALFSTKNDISLLYFAGHGHIESSGSFICPSDAKMGNDGISLTDVMTWANQSGALNKIIILDSCHSGAIAKHPVSDFVELSEGTTILTASTAKQYADEKNSSGVFTDLLIDALGGSAADLMGNITPASVYAHIDQSLGSWGQRPVFKTNVENFVSLRHIDPPLPLEDLLKITVLFPEPRFIYQLDPSYEPMRTEADKHAPDYVEPNAEHCAIFAVLQNYNRVNLLRPVGAPHMWHAAMYSKACSLTALGEHYRRLVAEKLI